MVRSRRSVSLHSGSPSTVKPFRGHRQSIKASTEIGNLDHGELADRRRALVNGDEIESERPPAKCSWCRTRNATKGVSTNEYCTRCRKLHKLAAKTKSPELQVKFRYLSNGQRRNRTEMQNAALKAREELKRLKHTAPKGKRPNRKTVCQRCRTQLPKSGKCGNCDN